MDRLPSLTAVRYFEVAARLQSFTAAAGELHVTQGAVSRMIQSLEQQLGARLFERNGRWITLTPAGRTYHGKISEALNQIATAGRLLRKSAEDETLSLIVNVGFATLWLVPNLADFRRKHPKIQVDILSGEASEQEHGRQAQMVIRYGSPPWTGFVATRLPVGPMLGVVCSPTLKGTEGVNQLADLLDKPLLSYTASRRDPWQDFMGHFGLQVPDLGQAPRFYQLLMLREAAISGLGFALVPLFLFEQDIQAGRLIQAIPQTYRSEQGYYLTHRPGADHDLKVQSFKKWLLARTRSTS
jgi:LysR family transcriptional regulator, glycine cleavage system transcriptional activator